MKENGERDKDKRNNVNDERSDSLDKREMKKSGKIV